MAIVTDAVAAYLEQTAGAPDAVVADMEAHARRDGVPVVPRVTAAFLGALTAALAPKLVVEVGTAIGMSTVFIARALPQDGRIVTFDVDPERREAARGYLERAGLLDRVDLRLADAREGIAGVEGPVDMAFIDGVKQQYSDYLDGVLPLLRPGGVVVADNVLMSGTVATGEPVGPWTEEHIAAMRAFNERLLGDPALDAALAPIGDGLALAVRRGG